MVLVFGAGKGGFVGFGFGGSSGSSLTSRGEHESRAFCKRSSHQCGITPFVAQSNEYPVPTSFDDRTWEFRAGVRFEMRRWHLTLEQGRSDFQDLQRIYETQRNPGNRGATPILGQQLFLSSLNQQYSIGGTGIFSRVLATASPFGVHRPMAAIHGGITSNGNTEPPIIINGNITIIVMRLAVRCVLPNVWSSRNTLSASRNTQNVGTVRKSVPTVPSRPCSPRA